MGFRANLWDYFVFGLGVGLARLVFVAIGLGIFIGGYFLLQKEKKLPAEEQTQSKKVTAYVLMGLGVVFLGGSGLYLLISEI